MVPLTNQEVYKLLNKENARNEAFRNANPQFELDNSNIASTISEIEYFENLYSNMSIGIHEFNEKDFTFKRVDRYTFQDIFSDKWSSFTQDNPDISIRDVVLEEVEKMMHCQDPASGHATYECPKCHESFCVPFTCKSRFCNTCGIKYQMDRAFRISTKLVNCTHRHMVFTIPEELRCYFRKYRVDLLNILFLSVEDTVLSYFRNSFPSKKVIPGLVLVLHTFGKDLKWNPHIHILVTEGGSSNIKKCSINDVWITNTYFNYTYLRKGFLGVLLKLMKSYLQPILSEKDFETFTKLCRYLYNHYKDGFYVRAKPPFKGNTEAAVKYLIRYFNRPVMAQTHILYYDDTHVVFYYQRHEDNLYVIEKILVYDFFERLIIHIPDKDFKMLRYAGIYSSHKCVHWDKLIKKLSDIAIKTKKMFNNWRYRIELSFKYDPLKCPFCNNSTMTLSDIFIAKPPP